jgi:hypothetical protein
MDSTGFTWAMIFRNEIKRFRDWASRVRHQSAEWELEYPDWLRFETAVFSFLNETDSAKWEVQIGMTFSTQLLVTMNVRIL